MIWRFGRHFALVVLVCVVAGKREISLCVVPGGGHFVLVLYVWYAKYVDLSRGKTNEVPIVSHWLRFKTVQTNTEVTINGKDLQPVIHE